MPADLTNTIATLITILVALFGAFLFALWMGMGIWTFNDIRARTRDWLAIGLATLLVLVFPVVGFVVYLMVRPKETLAELYDRALEEEALLRELEETLTCHRCGVPVKEAWVFCPHCHVQLQHTCTRCGGLVREEWDICVFCGTAQRRSSPVETPAPDYGTEPPYPEDPQTVEENLGYRPVTGERYSQQ